MSGRALQAVSFRRSAICGTPAMLGLLLALPIVFSPHAAEAAPPRRWPDEAHRRQRLAPPAAAKHEALIETQPRAELVFQATPGIGYLVRTRLPVQRVSIADPGVVDVVQHGPREFEIVGRSPGVTSMYVWIGQGGESQPVLGYRVIVAFPGETPAQAPPAVRYARPRMYDPQELFPDTTSPRGPGFRPR